MKRSLYALALIAVLPGCKKEEKKYADPPPFIVPNRDIDHELVEQEIVDEEEMPGAKRNRREGGDYVPAEFKDGAAKWKDNVVYVDGKPVAVMNFGELPVTLKPVWIEDKASAPKKYGSSDPGWRIIKQRHYRFTEYLTSLGVDLRKVQEIHVYGPNPRNVIVASGKELIERGDGFLFRFGGEVDGKTIPVVPENFGNGKSPDKVSGVMVYVEKTPPTLVRNQGMQLNGEIVKGVPYYGEPLRGGMRMYVDDKLTAIVKRRLLEDGKFPSVEKDGTIEWNLYGYLSAHGVDTSKIVEAWVIRDERRKEKLTKAELEEMTFECEAAASGEIKLGAKKIPTPILALHTKPVTPDQLPQIQPDEQL